MDSQNPMSTDARFLHLKTLPALKVLTGLEGWFYGESTPLYTTLYNIIYIKIYIIMYDFFLFY